MTTPAAPTPASATTWSTRRVVLLCLALVALTYAPWLPVGLMGDDPIVVSALEGNAAWMSRAPFDIWRYSSGVPEEVMAYVRSGGFPWWTHPDTKFHLFRPLSGVLHALEHTAFGRHFVGWRLHTLGWLLLQAIAASLILRRVLPAAAAPVALLLFSVNLLHVETSGQLTARHHLSAVTLGLFAVAAHLKWREDGWRPGAVLSPLLFALCFLSSEAGLASPAFVLAYELFGARGPLWARARAVAPAAILAVGYVATYFLAGHGTVNASGSVDSVALSIYIDPLREPLRFLIDGAYKLVSYAATFLTGSLTLFLWEVEAPRWLEMVVVALLGPVVYAVLRQLDEDARRPLRWLLAGALFSLLPGLSAPFGDKSLATAAVAVSAVAALVLVLFFRMVRGRVRFGWPLRAGLGVYALVILGCQVVAPLYMWPASAALYREATAEVTRPIDALPHDPRVTDVVVVSAMGALVEWGGQVRMYDPHLRRWWIVSPEQCEHVLQRTAEDTFELRFLRPPAGPEYEPPVYVVGQGQIVQQDLMRVEVLEMEGQAPSRIRVKLSRPLDDPSLLLVTYQDGKLVRIAPPAVGQTVSLPAITEEFW